jgi:uncharacterized ParB-like nuclease family protein
LLASETREESGGYMRGNGWHHVFQTLKQRGVDPLTDNERKLRRLPIQEIKTLEAVFQPRQMNEATAESGKHLGELKRVLQAKGELDPITVLKAGGEWLCLDGHHRLEAYRQAGGRRTHIPVRVFSGSLEDAFRLTIESNAPDKLNLTPDDKREAAWRMLLLGFSFRQINQATTISKGTIHNMDKAKQRVQEGWPSVVLEEWTWRDVKNLLNGEAGGRSDMWKEAKAREWARQIARTFSGLPSEHPRIFAQALLTYNAETAKAIAEEVRRLAGADGEEADF